MKIFLHDNEPANPGQPHGPDGLTHCGTLNFTGDYDYQIEMKLSEIAENHKHIVRARAEDGREWLKNAENVFVLQTSPAA